MLFDVIVNTVAQSYNIRPEDILGERRTKDIADARQVVCFLARQEAKKSYSEIARNLGNYDHTTVLYSYRKILNKIQIDENFKNYIEQISIILKNDENFKLGLNIPKISKAIKRKEESIKIEDNSPNSWQRMFRKEPENIGRQTKILGKYRDGFTLEEIGKIHGVTRERIRQIVKKGLLYEAYKIFDTGVELDLDVFLGKSTEEHYVKLKERRFIPDKPIAEKENKWSRDYDRCRTCGTNSVKHASYGYCEWCLTKSDAYKKSQRDSWLRNSEKRIRYAKKYSKEYSKRPEVIARLKKRINLKTLGGNREIVLNRDGYKCNVCGLSQKDSIGNLGRDLYIVHINGASNNLDNLITRCQNCHNNIMVKIMRQKLKKARL